MQYTYSLLIGIYVYVFKWLYDWLLPTYENKINMF